MLPGLLNMMSRLYAALLELVIHPTCVIAFDLEPEDTRLLHGPIQITEKNLSKRSNISLALVQDLVARGVAVICVSAKRARTHRSLNKSHAPHRRSARQREPVF